MFAHWQETAKKLHTGEFDLKGALRQLQSAFGHFAATQRNRDKQIILLEEFARYIRQHKIDNFEFHESKRHFGWVLTPQVQLTGITPWVFIREGLYYAYFCQEKEMDWEGDLKYPLLQKYMADNIVHCRLSELHMGVYCLEKRKFKFKRYSQVEVRKAVQDATQLFTNIYTEFSRLRKETVH